MEGHHLTAEPAAENLLVLFRLLETSVFPSPWVLLVLFIICPTFSFFARSGFPPG
jgi:hypothetical protein